MENSREIGRIQEQRVVKFLQQKEYKILEQNYYCRQGEIDIIAKDGKYLVFIEVKYRKHNKMGSPREAVNYQKQRKISKTAQYYIFKQQILQNQAIRFDVAEVTEKEIVIIKDAFLFQDGT